MSIPPAAQSNLGSNRETRAEAGKKPQAVEPAEAFSATPLGALLRVTHEALTHAILESLRDQGIEMTETEFSIMRYPGPDGVRPIDLARRCNMTKQSMNYVLAQFEAKGYIERRSPAGQRSTTIYLTPKGWKLHSATRHCAAEIEARWATHIGPRRFDAVRASLHEIAVWLGKWPTTPSREKSHVDIFRSEVEGFIAVSGTRARPSRDAKPARKKRKT
jgi:DNA-binding MarR family transcriptional regulator